MHNSRCPLFVSVGLDHNFTLLLFATVIAVCKRNAGMPGLKDLLKKKEKIDENAHAPPDGSAAPPEFKFIRSTTTNEEVIEPPTFPGDEPPAATKEKKQQGEHRRILGFRHSSNAAITKDPTATAPAASGERASQQLPARPKADRRLSERFHLGHHRGRSQSGSTESSANLPDDLPAAPEGVVAPTNPAAVSTTEQKEAKEQREAQWEKRATMLAMKNPLLDGQTDQETPSTRSKSRSPSIANETGDVNIQEAIRLHESGDLERSTAMFGRLAEPKGQNNALAQVLYGLALRHGWGIPVEPEKAIHYLSLAASNSASVEEQALASGMKRGGAAKGELVLAIFELANCFRHGWGVKKDAVAARQYYETAANLGDTDAMDEAAWCFLEGFGGGKDKVCSNVPSTMHALFRAALVVEYRLL